MTVDAPPFDPQLTGHAAIVIDGVCHAVGSTIDGGQRTECGTEIDMYADVGHREMHEQKEMCAECWPQNVVKEVDNAE